MTDRKLLDAYVAAGSHEAFSEIVARHSGPVYAACLRVLANEHEAEDVTQATFLILMRKAASLSHDTVLAGWLYRTATLAAKDARKGIRRRECHEQEVNVVQREGKTSAETEWNTLSPHLDEALASLPQSQRDVIVLRYLHGLSHAEVARELGCAEEAVHTRITRALATLRNRLSRREVRVSALLLAALLGQHAIQAAPSQLVSSIQAACSGKAGVRVNAMGITEGVMKAKYWSKRRMCVAGLLAALIAGISGIHFSGSKGVIKVQKISFSSEATAKKSSISPDSVFASITSGNVANKETFEQQDGARSTNLNAENRNTTHSRDKQQLSKGGLDWLASAQEENGHYDCERHGGIAGQDIAVTSLAALSFLGAGHTMKVGMYKEYVKKAMGWLKSQNPTEITQAALRTLVLAENAGMSNLEREVAQEAVNELITRQQDTGDWVDEVASNCYSRGVEPTTWAVMALKSAKVAGLIVPHRVFQKCVGSLDWQQSEALANEGNDTGAFMAAGISVQRQFTGSKRDDPAQLQMLNMLSGNLPVFPSEGIGDEVIVWYMGTLAKFQQGGTPKSEWIASLKGALISSQVNDGELAGSWDFRQGCQPFRWGRVGSTSLATLSLEIHYRYSLNYTRPSSEVEKVINGTTTNKVFPASQDTPPKDENF